MYRIAGADPDAAPRPSLGSRVGALVRPLFEAAGLARRRNDDGTLQPRDWRRLGTVVGGLALLWVISTSVHIVPSGTVGVPVTLGRAGDPLDQGLHITWPFTTVQELSSRTTGYTMSAAPGEGNRANIDDSVSVLGSDGAAASVDSTVLFRLDTARATEVYRELGPNYIITLIRPSARTCIRSVFTNYTMIDAATTAWHELETEVATCMADKLEPRGILLEDFQLRELHLDQQLQDAVSAKVAAEQDAERQQFELARAQQAADVTRVEAKATADAQQILACGGEITTIERDGREVQVVIPLPIEDCSQAQLTPSYLQFTYIQALKELVDSPNNSTIILPFDQNLTPLINIPAGGEPTVTTDPPAAQPEATSPDATQPDATAEATAGG